MEKNSTLIQATQSPKLPSEQTLEALLSAEKAARKEKPNYSYASLVGNWRLCFITGTKKTRQKAGVVLGAGRYIPGWVAIQLSYLNDEDSKGRVENKVEVGALQLSLSGPVEFLSAKNILAFDFTHLTLRLFGAAIYSGFIRGGKEAEEKFYSEGVGKKAFFAYFLVNEHIIAARGKGGGLALWRKET